MELSVQCSLEQDLQQPQVYPCLCTSVALGFPWDPFLGSHLNECSRKQN